MGIYISAIIQGILWSVMGLGLFVSFRMLRFADLTSEASFVVGAAVTVTLIGQEVPSVVATLLAMVAGSVTGLITGILMTYLQIPSLLAGIITLTALYSINLRIMGRANVSLRNQETVYDVFGTHLSDNGAKLLIGLVVVGLCIVLLHYFFQTDLGQAVIATGDNEVMAKSLGIHTAHMKCLALMISNGLIALCGGLLAQYNQFADVSMGLGTVIVALSSIIIGEVVFHRQLRLIARFASIVLGSVLYRVLLVVVLQLGFHPSDFRLVSASILAIFLALPALKSQFSLAKKG